MRIRDFKGFSHLETPPEYDTEDLWGDEEFLLGVELDKIIKRSEEDENKEN